MNTKNIQKRKQTQEGDSLLNTLSVLLTTLCEGLDNLVDLLLSNSEIINNFVGRLILGFVEVEVLITRELEWLHVLISDGEGGELLLHHFILQQNSIFFILFINVLNLLDSSEIVL